MKTRVAMFRGDQEAVQLDLIFQLTGSPTGPTLDLLKALPDWEKINFSKTYVSKMSKYNAFGRKAHSLLEKLLDVNPSTRISAGAALQEEYFTADKFPEPEE